MHGTLRLILYVAWLKKYSVDDFQLQNWCPVLLICAKDEFHASEFAR
jgi:hypothetical protein